jgi:hypothetical protein
LTLALAGAVVGLVCALVVSHLMARLLYGVRPTDPVTFAGVAFLFLAVVFTCLLSPSTLRHECGSDGGAAMRVESQKRKIDRFNSLELQ